MQQPSAPQSLRSRTNTHALPLDTRCLPCEPSFPTTTVTVYASPMKFVSAPGRGRYKVIARTYRVYQLDDRIEVPCFPSKFGRIEASGLLPGVHGHNPACQPLLPASGICSARGLDTNRLLACHISTQRPGWHQLLPKSHEGYQEISHVKAWSDPTDESTMSGEPQLPKTNMVRRFTIRRRWFRSCPHELGLAVYPYCVSFRTPPTRASRGIPPLR